MRNQSDEKINHQARTETASFNRIKAGRVTTDRAATDNLISAQNAVLKLVFENAGLRQTLEQVARIVDQNVPCVLTSICLYDPATGHMNAVVANTPAEMTFNYDGLPVTHSLNPYASAVFEKKPVIISDFSNDSRWPTTQRLALECGFHACWIFPVLGYGDAVLGLLILHSRQPRILDSENKRIIDIAADLTRLAIDYKNFRGSQSGSEGECNERLQRRTAELECANRALDAFCHSICHELKGPLRGMYGYADAIIEEAGDRLPSGCVEMVSRLQDTVLQMSDLVENLLSFACSSREPIAKTKVSMAQLVRALITEYDNQIQSGGFTISLGFLHDCPGNPALLRLVWQNLLSNALKYSVKSRQPTIEIGSTQAADRNIYWIKDNGIGFDQDSAARLFQPFQRLHSSSEYDGTGVGLALVDNIVRRHGGSVQAESRTDGGAAFYFTLPLGGTTESMSS